MPKTPITDRQVDTIETRVQEVLDDAKATHRLAAFQRRELERVVHTVVPLLRGIAADDGTVPGYGDDDVDDTETLDDIDAPPLTGPGSSREAWLDFAVQATGAPASSYGALSRDEIIALLENEGVLPTDDQ